VFLAVAVVMFGVTEFGRHVLRPFVRRTGIDDLGLTDSIGNLGGIIVQIFFTLAVCNPTKPGSYRFAALLAAGYIGYEFLQPYLPRGTFDWNDVLGTLLGLAVALPVLWILWRVFPDEQQSGGNSQ
jgi:hypothetical protein